MRNFYDLSPTPLHQTVNPSHILAPAIAMAMRP